MRRRSLKVTAPLLAAAAVAMSSGCRRPEMQRCVDENDHVVDDSLCANLPQANGSPQPATGMGNGAAFYPLYHYYYGGWGGYTPGTVVGGGSRSPIDGHSYITSRGVRSGTVRGGLGHWFSSHGSSHGGGG